MSAVNESLPLLHTTGSAVEDGRASPVYNVCQEGICFPADPCLYRKPMTYATHLPSRKRGILLTFCTAIGVFVMASSFGQMLTTVRRDSDETIYGSGHSAHQDAGVIDVVASRSRQNFDLISPTNKQKKPTKTYTADCTGDKTRPVLAGADVVAYRDLEDGSSPVIGLGGVNATHNGYIFFFSSLENRKAFQDNPETYLPAWGGFCSYGIAAETVWTAENLGPFADPSKWKIMPDGRLHVFRSNAPMGKFALDPQAYNGAGNANWNAWWHGAEGPMNTDGRLSGRSSVVPALSQTTAFST